MYKITGTLKKQPTCLALVKFMFSFLLRLCQKGSILCCFIRQYNKFLFSFFPIRGINKKVNQTNHQQHDRDEGPCG